MWFTRRTERAVVPVPEGDRCLVALVPAHNEAEQLPDTIASLRAQTRRPDRIVVIANNCTDDTVRVARLLAVEVIVLEHNPGKKAGALNYALDRILDSLDLDDSILVMDADTTLHEDFLANAEATLSGMVRIACARCQRQRTYCSTCRAKGPIGAVGGVFSAKEPQRRRTFPEVLQTLEYARYGHELGVRGHRAAVLTGTATLFRVATLEHIRRTRQAHVIPAGTSHESSPIYDEVSLTEDNEITYAVRALGYRCVSPPQCIVWTDIMRTWTELYHQRLRWQRGALDNLWMYRRWRIARRNLLQQAMLHIGALMTILYVGLLSGTLLAGIRLSWSPIWIAAMLIPSAEKALSVRGRVSRFDQFIAALLIPEMIGDFFRQYVLWRALGKSLGRRSQGWAPTSSLARPASPRRIASSVLSVSRLSPAPITHLQEHAS